MAERPSATLRAASHGAGSLGGWGSKASPHPQKYPPLSLHESLGREPTRAQGEGAGEGVGRRSPLRNVLGGDPLDDPLEAHRRHFVLRDLGDWIDGIDRQQIGGRLGIVEGHKDGSLR